MKSYVCFILLHVFSITLTMENTDHKAYGTFIKDDNIQQKILDNLKLAITEKEMLEIDRIFKQHYKHLSTLSATQKNDILLFTEEQKRLTALHAQQKKQQCKTKLLFGGVLGIYTLFQFANAVIAGKNLNDLSDECRGQLNITQTFTMTPFAIATNSGLFATAGGLLYKGWQDYTLREIDDMERVIVLIKRLLPTLTHGNQIIDNH